MIIKQYKIDLLDSRYESIVQEGNSKICVCPHQTYTGSIKSIRNYLITSFPDSEICVDEKQLEKLLEEGFTCFILKKDNNVIPYKGFEAKRRMAFIQGNGNIH